MVALVHDHMTIVAHEVQDPFTGCQALDHGHIHPSCGHLPASANLADLLRALSEEGLELGPPLLKKWLE